MLNMNNPINKYKIRGEAKEILQKERSNSHIERITQKNYHI